MPVISDSRNEMKIAIVGESGVGKTSIVRRFINKQNNPVEDIRTTIGVDKSQTMHHVDGESFSLFVLDMAGSPHFEPLVKSYLAQVDAVIFVYDITDKDSFAMLPVWHTLVAECCQLGANDVNRLLVGNKKDLRREREVSFGNAQTYAGFEGMVALEVSAKDDDCVDLIFQCATQELKSKFRSSAEKRQVKKAKFSLTKHCSGMMA